ncbi:uncharacterized protein LOC113229776 [Hyposmocoma kahamanoa]|uniref:uncharacterized protein LOC113229776 n=1 Tax=Hyposmocoma kahamanoa TaxID=1477025 RepID=UPI000E6D9816|nr:uncharacterized protein LOC113229776 [Hyposmocoma kahamanoa]
MVVFYIFLITFVASGLGAVIPPSNTSHFDGQINLERIVCGRVWITVHTLEVRQSTNTILDAIELNWDYTGCISAWRQIALFDFQPGATSWHDALVKNDTIMQTGRFVTNVPLGDVNLPGGWQNGQGTRGTHCLWPWIGGGATNVEIINCLKIQPTWMQDNADLINNLRLGELALPGTHNAGSWRFNSPISDAARDLFVLCQDRSIWSQLVHGIRYLDFRASYYNTYPNEDDRYWLNHNFVRVRPLVPLLREIRQFLDSTRELVILHFHQFPVGFEENNVLNRNVHAGLLRIIERELGPHIARAHDFPWTAGSRGPVLSSFINANRRLIVPYNQDRIVSENNWLFPQLPHLWANTNNVDELFRYLDNQLQTQNPRPTSRNPMHSAMAQTTLTATDIALFRSSIRQAANDVNHRVTWRLLNQWRRTSNIIASDFFLGNDVIDMSIIVSRERGLQKVEMADTNDETI